MTSPSLFASLREKRVLTMPDRVHHPPNLIYSIGTQVVSLVEIVGQGGRVLHPRGAIGVVVRSPKDLDHPYRVRFPDGIEESLNSGQITMLARFKEAEIGDVAVTATATRVNLYDRVIYRCVIGSQAYGLAGDDSDIDRRGIYLPPADLRSSLYGAPDQLENDGTQEAYWEPRKFLVLALKANPNVLECLYTPMVEKATPLAENLLGMRSIFLSRMVYQTYNGYVLSQFKKMQSDLRNQGQVKWKHVMHLIRLLLSGTRNHAHHYLGFVETQWRLFQKEDPPHVKPLLYVYRVLLTGIHLMRTGEVQANLVRLNETFRLP